MQILSPKNWKHTESEDLHSNNTKRIRNYRKIHVNKPEAKFLYN